MAENKNTKMDEKVEKEETKIEEKKTEVSEAVAEEVKKKVEVLKKGEKPKIEKSEEREYVIPLRAKLVQVQKYRRASKAIRLVKQFLVRHMKVRDGDLNKIRIDKYLNDFIWARGIKNPPSKIRVRTFKEGEIVRVELFELTDKLKFKKGKLDKRATRASDGGKKKIKKEEPKPEEKTVEEKKDIQEKKASVVETGKARSKSEAVKSKHTTKGATGPKTKPVRKALGK